MSKKTAGQIASDLMKKKFKVMKLRMLLMFNELVKKSI